MEFLYESSHGPGGGNCWIAKRASRGVETIDDIGECHRSGLYSLRIHEKRRIIGKNVSTNLKKRSYFRLEMYRSRGHCRRRCRGGKISETRLCGDKVQRTKRLFCVCLRL